MLNKVTKSIMGLSIILGCSTAMAKGFPVTHVFAVGGGIAHPSFLGSGNPVGYMYNNGFTLGAFAESFQETNGIVDPPLYYSGGFSAGTGKVGMGLYAHGVENQGGATNDLSYSFGLSADLFDGLALGLAGSAGQGGADFSGLGLILNPNDQHRFGAYVNSNASLLGFGYAYGNESAVLAIDALHLPDFDLTTAYLGLGVYWQALQMVVNFAYDFDSSTNQGLSHTFLGLGVGLGSAVHLMLYGNSGYYGLGLTASF